MSDPASVLHAQISAHLVAITALFAEPDQVKITLLVRTPWLADGGVLISDDEPEAAHREWDRLLAKPKVGP